VGQFVDALKSGIINGLAFGDLGENNCENVDATLLDYLQSFLKAENASSPYPSTIHDTEPPDNVPGSFHVAQKREKDIGAAVNIGTMEVFSLAYVSGSIANRCFVVSAVMHARHT
jgi:hypothetical protein